MISMILLMSILLMESIESSRKDKDDVFPERFNQYVASGQSSKDLMRHIAEYANSMDKVGRWTVDRERCSGFVHAC